MDFLQSNTSSKVLKSIVKVKKDQAWGDQKFSSQESIAKVSSLKSQIIDNSSVLIQEIDKLNPIFFEVHSFSLSNLGLDIVEVLM